MPARGNAKSAVRSIEILLQLARERRELRAIDFARALDLPLSSTDQILKTMVAGGFLLLNPVGKTYLPSPSLIPVGSWIRDTYHADDYRRVLEILHERTGATVSVAIQNDCHTQLFDVLGTSDLHFRLPVGIRTPILTGSAVGGAVLMASSDDRRERILARSQRLRGSQRIPFDPDQIVRRVQAFQDAGFAWACYDRVAATQGWDWPDPDQAMALAVPVEGGSLPMALAVGASVGFIGMHRDTILDALKSCAALLA